MVTMSRREMLMSTGGALAGAAAMTAMPAMAGPTLPDNELWTPHKLDPAECAPYGYEGYWHKGYGCCHGVFYSIVGVMGEKHGAPYNTFPFRMMEVGKSGISGWGTICGALLGAAAAYAMFWGRKERDPMVSELFRWYEQAALPIYEPVEADARFKGPQPTTVCESVLCHISVSKWCLEHGVPAKSKQRSDRCGRITADVTVKAIEIMNAKIDNPQEFAGLYGKQDSLEYCGTCHADGMESPVLKTKMDCTPCHSGSEHTLDKFNDHP